MIVDRGRFLMALDSLANSRRIDLSRGNVLTLQAQERSGPITASAQITVFTSLDVPKSWAESIPSASGRVLSLSGGILEIDARDRDTAFVSVTGLASGQSVDVAYAVDDREPDRSVRLATYNKAATGTEAARSLYMDHAGQIRSVGFALPASDTGTVTVRVVDDTGAITSVGTASITSDDSGKDSGIAWTSGSGAFSAGDRLQIEPTSGFASSGAGSAISVFGTEVSL